MGSSGSSPLHLQYLEDCAADPATLIIEFIDAAHNTYSHYNVSEQEDAMT